MESGAGRDVLRESTVTAAVSSLAEKAVRMMFLARLCLVVAALATAMAGVATSVALGLPPTAVEFPKAGSTRAGPADEAGAARDRYGDLVPEDAVTRLGSTRFRGGGWSVDAMRFAPDGQTLITVSEDFVLRLWETKTGRLLHQALLGPGSVAGRPGIAFSPDGKQIALSGMQRAAGGKPGYDPVRLVVDAATGNEVSRLPARINDSDLALAFTPDGKSLISLGYKGILRIEEIRSGVEQLHRDFPRDGTGTLVVSPAGKLVAIWSGANTQKLYLWGWQGADEPRGVKVPRQSIGNLVFSPDGKSLLACDDYKPFVYEWDVATGDLTHEFTLRDDVTPRGLAVSPDGQTIAVSDSGNHRDKGFSGGVLLLGRGSGKLVRELPTPGAEAMDVVFSPDGRWLSASGGVGVHVWEWQTGAEVAAGSAGHQGEIAEIATAPGGLIATASRDHTVRLWDAATGVERRRLPHRAWVRAIAVSPDGRFLASSSLDDTVRLWDIGSAVS